MHANALEFNGFITYMTQQNLFCLSISCCCMLANSYDRLQGSAIHSNVGQRDGLQSTSKIVDCWCQWISGYYNQWFAVCRRHSWCDRQLLPFSEQWQQLLASQRCVVCNGSISKCSNKHTQLLAFLERKLVRRKVFPRTKELSDKVLAVHLVKSAVTVTSNRTAFSFFIDGITVWDTVSPELLFGW